ncbi:MAG: peptide chain release factor 1 [Deltaproteobacteria bacterium]|nr:peptide chain release factor 1 [Deltaproteobacteria bacterium]
MSDTFLDKMTEVELRFQELEGALSRSESLSNPKEYARLAKERSSLEELVACFRVWRKTKEEIANNKPLLEDSDPAVREMAREEQDTLEANYIRLESELQHLLVPKDPLDDKNVLLEIRAGTGGDEASLFVADLYRMYTRYAETHGWRMETMSASPTGLGGFKEIISLIEGKGAYSRLKYEGGVHRVQRVPATEASGRIHTSAVTVAVLPEADEVDVHIDDKDLRIDVFRSSGPGGQSVNTTDSAVRITHLPTNLVVSCQDEKSQHKNKAKGLKILRARLLERARDEQQAAISASRRSMVGSGDRSERIRTYNFPQSRLTDHRINLTVYTLDRALDGEIDALMDALTSFHQAEALKSQSDALSSSGE